MVRLKDIAAHAGVTVMTVSKALRDAPDIAVATKARIKQVAQQMGYVPDSQAQGLRTRTTKLFGLVVPAVTNPIFARAVLAIEERAFEMGYDLVIAHTLNLPEREDLAIRRMLARRVDGLFVSPVYRLSLTVPIYDELRRRGTAVVVLGHAAPFCSKFVCIETDDVLASAAITQHLLQLSHRRIAFFSGPAGVPWAQERLEGHRRALREAQFELDDRLVFSAGSNIEDGEKAALQMLNEAPQATAIQAVNDLVAVGAANTLLSQGLKIPQHVSITGFGNFLVGEYFRVPLTTVRQPKYRLGQAAIAAMVELLRGERPASKRLAGQIEIRQSTAAPLDIQPGTGTSPNAL